MSISKVRLPNNTEEDIKAKYLIQSTSSDVVSEEFVTKTTTEDAIANIQKIYGNTVKWNQLIQNGNFANGTTGWTGGSTNVSMSVSNGIMTVTTGSGNTCIRQDINFINQHKYYISFIINAATSGYIVYFVSPTQWLGSLPDTSLNTDYRFHTVVTANSNKTQIYFGRYGNTSGTSYKLSNVWVVDLTEIYGSGNEPTVSEFEAQYPAAYYPYSPPTLSSNSATSIQSKDSSNNVIGNCDLNIPTLTGKLNGTGSSVVIFPNGMGYDGMNRDELYGGKAKKRVGRVNLGDLTWGSDTVGGHTRFYATLADAKKDDSLYQLSSQINSYGYISSPSPVLNNSVNLALAKYNDRIYIRNDTYDGQNGNVFKAAMNGVILNYELITYKDYILDNSLQLQYPVVAGGTEMVLPTTGTAPMKMDVIYGNAADATSNLSSNFISVDSMKAFLNNLGTQMGGTWNMQYNNGKFEFTFSSN